MLTSSPASTSSARAATTASEQPFVYPLKRQFVEPDWARIPGNAGPIGLDELALQRVDEGLLRGRRGRARAARAGGRRGQHAAFTNTSLDGNVDELGDLVFGHRDLVRAAL